MKTRLFSLLTLVIVAILTPITILAQTVEQGFPVDEILDGSIQAVYTWQSLGWQAGLSAVIVVFIGLIKNSLFRKYLWDKFPKYIKFLVPALLSLAVVLLGVTDWSANAVILTMTTGVGAMALHQLFKAVKEIPGVGPKVGGFLDWVGKWLKKPEETK